MAAPTVRTVNAQNQNHLVFAASNEAGWRRYLETLSRHTGCANAFYNLSAMNCAGLAASDWHESREILPIATWRSLFPGADIKAADGCRGVYGVKSRPRGSGGGLFYVDELFPPALLVGLPPTRLRGASRVLDLSVDIAAASWNDAKAGLHRLVNVADMDGDADAAPEAERVPVAWDDLDENTRFVIEAHFRAQGPGCASPVLPPDDVRAKASSLKRYVNEIVKTAAPLIRQMRNGYRAAFERHRRDVIPESDPSRESVRGAAESGIAGKAGGVEESRLLESVGDAGAAGRHFARKGGAASPPGAGPQGGSLEVADTEAEPCPVTPSVPMRAAGAGDRSPDAKTDRGTAGDTGGAVPAGEGGRLAESRAEAHERRRERLGRHGRPMERGADDGGEVDVLRPRGRRYRREEGDGEAGGPERHAMRRRRSSEAKPEPVAPPEKYYPHGRPPRETAGHAKSAAARTAKDRGKKKKPPTGKGSS